MLALWGLDEIGLGGATAAALLAIGVGALTAPAVLVAVRALAGEAPARAVAPFVVFTPAAVWMATSLDALYAGVSAVGIALFAVACGERPPGACVRPSPWAFAAGLVLGAALQLSYGLATVGAVVLAIAAGRRRPAAVAWAAAGVAIVFAAFAAARFNWFDGLAATREEYLAGVSRRRRTRTSCSSRSPRSRSPPGRRSQVSRGCATAAPGCWRAARSSRSRRPTCRECRRARPSGSGCTSCPGCSSRRWRCAARAAG